MFETWFRTVSVTIDMPWFDYRYELRRGGKIVSTGRFGREQPVEVGDPIVIGGQPGIVRTVEPLLGERDLHLVIRLGGEDVDS